MSDRDVFACVDPPRTAPDGWERVSCADAVSFMSSDLRAKDLIFFGYAPGFTPGPFDTLAERGRAIGYFAPSWVATLIPVWRSGAFASCRKLAGFAHQLPEDEANEVVDLARCAWALGGKPALEQAITDEAMRVWRRHHEASVALMCEHGVAERWARDRLLERRMLVTDDGQLVTIVLDPALCPGDRDAPRR